VTWRLKTERLDLRPMEAGDLDAMYAVLSDPVSMRFYPQPFDRERSRRWIGWAHERYERMSSQFPV